MGPLYRNLHDPHGDYGARLPPVFRTVVDAINAAGWDHRVSTVGPVRVGDVQREVVEVSASTRAGHRLRVVFVADAPPGQPRPPFAPLAARVGQGAAVTDASLGDAVAYVRAHPSKGPTNSL